MSNTHTATAARTAAQWVDLVRVAVRGVTDEQAVAIGAMCFDAERAGENPAVWHQSALFFGNRCNCAVCKSAIV